MRKFYLILFFASTTLFVSCNKDDDESPVDIEATDLAGDWAITKLETNNGKTTAELLGQKAVVEFTAYGKDFETVLNLNGEANTFASEGGYTTVITTEDSEGSTTEESVTSFPAAGSWMLDGDTLTFTIDGVAAPYKITSFENGEMSWKQEIDETVDFFGVLTTVTATYTYVLEKQ